MQHDIIFKELFNFLDLLVVCSNTSIVEVKNIEHKGTYVPLCSMFLTSTIDVFEQTTRRSKCSSSWNYVVFERRARMFCQI